MCTNKQLNVQCWWLWLQVLGQLRVVARAEGSAERFDREVWSAELSPLLNLWKKLNQVTLTQTWVINLTQALFYIRRTGLRAGYKEGGSSLRQAGLPSAGLCVSGEVQCSETGGGGRETWLQSNPAFSFIKQLFVVMYVSYYYIF